eukprot:scaffold14932_cov54-Phaeocystis_antarctica.AAC.1
MHRIAAPKHMVTGCAPGGGRRIRPSGAAAAPRAPAPARTEVSSTCFLTAPWLANLHGWQLGDRGRVEVLHQQRAPLRTSPPSSLSSVSAAATAAAAVATAGHHLAQPREASAIRSRRGRQQQAGAPLLGQLREHLIRVRVRVRVRVR